MLTKKQNNTEAHYRSFLKAISWRIWAFLATVLISFMVTGSTKFAITIGSTEFVIKFFLFYIHERIWLNLFNFGYKERHTRELA